MKPISCIANIIWIIFGGLATAIGWFLLGCLLCITIILIPFGKQCFKFAKLTLAPFGKKVTLNYGKHPIINTIWLILFGIPMFLSYVFAGIACCITIIGFPAGLMSFKFSVLALAPFGAKVTSK